MNIRAVFGKVLKKAGIAVILAAVLFCGRASADFRNTDIRELKKDLIFPTSGEITLREVLSPDGDPGFDEFLFYEDDVSEKGIPEEAVIQHAHYIWGSWKYCLTFNRDVPGAERIDEIGLAKVSFDGDEVQLILHPQLIRFGSHVEPEDEESVGYVPFTGGIEEGRVEVSANGTSFVIGTFYSYEGKDYSIGSVTAEATGLVGDVLLVRP